MLTRDHSSSDIISWSEGFYYFVRTNWRIPIGGATLAIGVAAVLLYMLPNYYRSQSSLPLTVNARIALRSTAFLTPIATNSLTEEFKGDISAAILRLRERLSNPIELDRVTSLYRVELTWDSPKKAKELLTSIVNEAIKWSRPIGSDREIRLDQIKTLENNIPNLRKLYSQLLAQAESNPDRLDLDRIPATLFAIENDISQKQTKLTSLRRSLDGNAPEDVIEWPSDPEKTGGRLAIAALAAVTILLLTALLLYFLYQLSLRREQQGIN